MKNGPMMRQIKNMMYKPCPPGKKINPLTGRCIKVNVVKKIKTCPSGKMINPLTGRCIKVNVVKKIKTCPTGKMINPLTGRCIKVPVVGKRSLYQGACGRQRCQTAAKFGYYPSCPPNKVYNPMSNRCIKHSTLLKSQQLQQTAYYNKLMKKENPNYIKMPRSNIPTNKPENCQPGKIVNHKTGKCVKYESLNSYDVLNNLYAQKNRTGCGFEKPGCQASNHCKWTEEKNGTNGKCQTKNDFVKAYFNKLGGQGRWSKRDTEKENQERKMIMLWLARGLSHSLNSNTGRPYN